MTTAYTSLLGLALPVTGELSGTWGDTVNNSITSLLDSAIAGTTTLSSDADVTLTTTTGASNTSRQAILLWTAGGTVTRNITAPAQSKIYTVINKSSSTQSIVLRGVGPTTGVTIVKGESAVCAWNGSDFIKISNTSGAGVFTTVTASSLTSGRVTYATTAGLLTDSANLLYSGTDLTVYGLTVGRGAGAVATNTAVGASALAANTSGSNNVAVGYRALSSMTTGNTCVAIGQDALKVSVAGTENTAVGFQSMLSTLTASANSALGLNSLSNNTTGNNNTAIGYAALTANTTASGNTAVGYQALTGNTTGTGLVAVGYLALNTNTTGVANTAIGGQYTGFSPAAMSANSTGSYNIAVGTGALQANTTASSNTAVGYQAGYSNTTGTQVAAFGYQAMYSHTSGNYSSAFGYRAMFSTTTGIQNNAFGADTLYANTTGNYNSAFGEIALRYNTTGSNNVAIGSNALFNNTTASNNTAVGYQAGYTNSTGTNNVFLGGVAGYTSNGSSNLHVGYGAGYSSTGSNNTFVGAFGTGSTASGGSMTTGSKNTILGSYSGNQGGLDIRTASNYIVLSDGDGNPRMYNAGSYYWSLVGTSATTCGAILFRNSSQTQYWNNEASSGEWYVFGSSTYVYFAQGGSSWVFSSDRRIKENIVDIDYGLNAVMQLKPRRYDNTTSEKNEIGFVAQELREVIPEAVTGEEIEFDENDTTMERAKKSLGVSKDTLIPVLVKAIQELKAEIDSLKSQLNGA